MYDEQDVYGKSTSILIELEKDMSKRELQEPKYTLLNNMCGTELPKYTWKCIIGGDEQFGFTISYTDEHTPCWFHRKMQEIVLGIKWRKIK